MAKNGAQEFVASLERGLRVLQSFSRENDWSTRKPRSSEATNSWVPFFAMRRTDYRYFTDD